MVRSEVQAERLVERPHAKWAALAAALVVTAAMPPLAMAQAGAAPAPNEALPPDAIPANEADRVLLESDIIDQDDEAKTVTADGDVQVRYQGRTLRADRVVYYLETHNILATGNVQMVEADGTVSYFEELQVDEAFGVGVATNMRARLAGDATLAARTVVRVSPTRNELSRIIYTSCRICETGDRPPTWSLRARRAIQDREDKTISYRGMTLEMLGVPILWLPYFAHQDPSAGPHSGLLMPSLGGDRRLGAFYEQPYYWRISDHQDATVSLRLHENVNPLLGVDYRRRFWNGDLSLDMSVTQDQDFGDDGIKFGEDETRGHIFGRGLFRVNDYWSWGFGIERATDDLYLRRYDITGAGERRGPYVGDWLNLVSQLYAIGQDENSFGQVNFIAFQGLRENDTSNLNPLILPTADYERVFNDVLGGQLRWRSNIAVLDRSTSTDSARATTGLTWRTSTVVGPGLLLSPFAEVRGDFFRIAPEGVPEENFTRGSALAGAEISWPMMRPGENVDLIVEPVVMAAYGSEGGDDPRILNEDSVAFELDDSNLFRPSATPNFDLWEPGARLAAGVRASARARNGMNASALFGRRFRSESIPNSVLTENGDPSFGAETNANERASDYVAAAQLDLGRSLGAVVRTRLDDSTLDVRRLDAEVRGALGRLSAYGRYFQVDDSLQVNTDAPSRELSASIGVQLMRGWRVQFGVRRDLDSNTNLSQDIRAIYEDDCTFLELAYVRSETTDRQLGPNEGFQFRVGLRTLGVFGAAQ